MSRTSRWTKAEGEEQEPEEEKAELVDSMLEEWRVLLELRAQLRAKEEQENKLKKQEEKIEVLENDKEELEGQRLNLQDQLA